MNNLSTQIATTREQSERLLAIGVKPETADMFYALENGTQSLCALPYTDGVQIPFDDVIPAWSLSRLISMLPPFISGMKSGREPHHPELIKSKQGYVLSIRRRTADCLVGTHIEKDPIECCVSMIDWLIKNNYFNKEYLCLE